MRGAMIILVVALLAACSFEPAPLVASNIVIAKPVPGTSMTAGYFTLTNNASQAITITHITSPQFESVEMHESVIEDGMSRMYPLNDLMLLAGTSVTFEPGGKHLMLTRPHSAVDTITLEFHAGKALVLTVNAVPTE